MNERFRDIDQRDGCGCERRRADHKPSHKDCGCERHGEDHRIELLLKIQRLNFMMIEAGLYLNNQCDCEAAQAAFCDYQRRHAEAVAEYEECYGPLTYDGVNAKKDGWSWVRGPWPWEAEDC